MTLPGWDLNLLEDLIQSRGDLVVHEMSIACTCRAEDFYTSFIFKDGSPARVGKLHCPQCNGDGYGYRNAQTVRGLVTSIFPANRQLIEQGWAQPGDCTFSPSMYAPVVADFDKITFTTDTTVDDGQIIMRGAHTMDTNQFLKTNLQTNEDRLWYNATCALWCEDEDGVVYGQNTDFTICQNKIIWGSTNAPDIGKFYTIKYRAYLEWVCLMTPMMRYDHGTYLGNKVLLRKKHVHFANDTDKATPQQRKAIEEKFTTRTKF